MKTIRAVSIMFLACLLSLAPAWADAGVVSTVGNITMNYVVGETITVSGVPPSFSFLGTTPSFTGLAITTTWNLAAGRSHVDTIMYLSSPTQALSDGAGHFITAAQVFQQKNGAGFLACTKPSTYFPTEVQATVVSGAGCAGQDNVTITGANQAGTNTSTYDFQLQGLPANLPAGTYTGVLNIVAGAA